MKEFYITPEHKKTITKNDKLIEQLSDFRDNALGLGTNKLKRRLNKLAKTDVVAKAYRLALEAEDKSIQAKKTYGGFKNKIYEQKRILINKLITVCHMENWVYGEVILKERNTNSIVFFELPNCEQISFHTTIDWLMPLYNKEWDGKINSTYPKLLDAILLTYPEINKN